MSHFHQDKKTGVYSAEIADRGKLEKISTKIDFKQFYMELNELLVNENFKDCLGYKKDKAIGNFFGHWNKKGEFGQSKNLSRKYNSYETLFLKNTYHNRTEYEIIWFAHKESEISPYGWSEFKFDLTVRNIEDVEILEGNKKKTLQQGGWELRNEFTYKNSIVPKFLKTVPFVKNHPALQHMYVNNIYLKTMKTDFEFFKEKIYEEKILDLIRKHFNSNLMH